MVVEILQLPRDGLELLIELPDPLRLPVDLRFAEDQFIFLLLRLQSRRSVPRSRRVRVSGPTSPARSGCAPRPPAVFPPSILRLFSSRGFPSGSSAGEATGCSAGRVAGARGRGGGNRGLLLAPLLDEVGVVAPVLVADAVPKLEDAADEAVEEVAVVGDDQDRPLIAEQGVLKDLPGLDVEVVRRFVEDEEVRVRQEDLQEGEARFLPAGEDGDLLVDVVAGEEKGAQEVPPLLVVAPRPRGADLLPDGPLVVEVLGAFLGEEGHLHVQAR